MEPWPCQVPHRRRRLVKTKNHEQLLYLSDKPFGNRSIRKRLTDANGSVHVGQGLLAWPRQLPREAESAASSGGFGFRFSRRPIISEFKEVPLQVTKPACRGRVPDGNAESISPSPGVGGVGRSGPSAESVVAAG